jgi:alpha-tubulin suppressor-like RCC1 family protein
VAGLAGKTVVRLVSGADHVLALTSSGELLSWGCFEQGRCVLCSRVRNGPELRTVRLGTNAWAQRHV